MFSGVSKIPPGPVRRERPCPKMLRKWFKHHLGLLSCPWGAGARGRQAPGGPSQARAQPGPNPSRPGPKPRLGPSQAQARAGPWARRHGVKLTRLRHNGSIVERISANCLTSCLMLRASMSIRATRYIYRTFLWTLKDNFCLEGVSMHQPSSRETCLFLHHGRRLSLITLQCYQRREVSCYIRQFHPIKTKIST